MAHPSAWVAVPHRRALEGELALLERAWREAEEIAAISDSLLLAATIELSMRNRSDTSD